MLPGYLPFFFKFLPRVITFFHVQPCLVSLLLQKFEENKFYLAQFATGEPTEISGPQVWLQQFQYS